MILLTFFDGIDINIFYIVRENVHCMFLFHLNKVKVFKEMRAVYQVSCCFVLLNKSKKKKKGNQLIQGMDFI